MDVRSSVRPEDQCVGNTGFALRNSAESIQHGIEISTIRRVEAPARSTPPRPFSVSACIARIMDRVRASARWSAIGLDSPGKGWDTLHDIRYRCSSDRRRDSRGAGPSAGGTPDPSVPGNSNREISLLSVGRTGAFGTRVPSGKVMLKADTIYLKISMATPRRTRPGPVRPVDEIALHPNSRRRLGLREGGVVTRGRARWRARFSAAASLRAHDVSGSKSRVGTEKMRSMTPRGAASGKNSHGNGGAFPGRERPSLHRGLHNTGGKAAS